MTTQRVRAVVFDVGGTLVRDDRYWAGWADWLDVPRHTLSALLGAVVGSGRPDDEALRMLRPGFDRTAEAAAREAAGRGEVLEEEDLYPDVRPALGALRAAGLRVAVAGNQSARAGELLRALRLPVDALAVSEEWGVHKPDPAFFARVLGLGGASAGETVYVGDLPANDVTPARAAGLRTVHLRRGPWGHLWAEGWEAAAATWRVDSLTDLPPLLAAGPLTV